MLCSKFGFGLLALMLLPIAAPADEAIRLEPGWSYGSFKRAGVVPTQLTAALRDNAAAVEAARVVWFTLEDYLSQTAEFRVLSRDAVKALAEEFDFTQIADGKETHQVIPADAITTADVLFISVIDVYETRNERRTEKRTRYAKEKTRIKRDSQGQPIPIDEEELTIYRHEARVGGLVHVVDASTGKLLLTHRVEPIEVFREARDNPPRESPAELGKKAAELLGLDCHRNVAPQSFQTKLKSNMLVVAFDYYDNAYDETKEVYPTLEEFVVAVRNLPHPCSRYRFTLAIGLKDGRELWKESFVWSDDNIGRGVMFRVPVKLLVTTDQEKFELRLYPPGGTEPIEERAFKLEAPGG